VVHRAEQVVEERLFDILDARSLYQCLSWIYPRRSTAIEGLYWTRTGEQSSFIVLNFPLKRSSDMHATVRRYEGVTDPSEAGRRVNEGFVPLISKVPGFVAYYWVDAGGGVMISTSVFQDQSGAEESNKRAADYVRENLASLLPKPPQITAGEVVAYKGK
jgi:hypothetical protein